MVLRVSSQGMKLYLCCQRLKREKRIGILSFRSTTSKLNGFSTEGEGPSEVKGKNQEFSNALRVH